MKNKHLSYDDRLEIEKGLNQRKSFTEIANIIGKYKTTISREITNHVSIENKGGIGRKFNNCLNRSNCPNRSTCKCNKNFCQDYIIEECEKLKHAPYVCNGCGNKHICTLTKHYYKSEIAQKEYLQTVVESKTGTTFSDEELSHFEDILYPLIVEKGQSVHVACISNKDKIMCCEKEIYNLIDQGYFSKIKNIDLPRKVRRRIRRKRKTYFKIDKECLNGRTYNDFISYMSKHPDTNYVEMDSVEGTKGGKVLLTLHFVNCSFMIAILREHNDSQSVIDFFNKLQEKIGLDLFRKLFPIILTDNGSEFSNPTKIEFDDNGNQRTKIFYCEPGRSDQKGSCENNHELIRRFIPQGKPLEPYSQNDIDLMMSHINSYLRNNLNDKTPIDVFKYLYNVSEEDMISIFNIRTIVSNNVFISNKLFTKNNDKNTKL